MNSQSDYVFKVVIVGDSYIGKTQLLRNYVGMPEIGTIKDSVEKVIQRNGRTVKLIISDTMGLERFRSVTASYYRHANGVILCYSEVSQESFASLEKIWLKDTEQFLGTHIPKVLVGIKPIHEQNSSAHVTTNRLDHVISHDDRTSLVCRYSMPCMTVSLSNMDDIEAVFQKVSALMIELLPDRTEDLNDSFKLDAEKRTRTTQGCSC